MKEKLRFLGLDVHAETIAVAIAEPDGEVRSLGTIPNRAESIRKMIKKLGSNCRGIRLGPKGSSKRKKPGGKLLLLPSTEPRGRGAHNSSWRTAHARREGVENHAELQKEPIFIQTARIREDRPVWISK
jgi:hypothetical protein